MKVHKHWGAACGLPAGSGTRSGPDAQLMKPVTAKLTVDDVISLAAYLASLHP